MLVILMTPIATHSRVYSIIMKLRIQPCVPQVTSGLPPPMELKFERVMVPFMLLHINRCAMLPILVLIGASISCQLYQSSQCGYVDE